MERYEVFSNESSFEFINTKDKDVAIAVAESISGSYEVVIMLQYIEEKQVMGWWYEDGRTDTIGKVDYIDAICPQPAWFPKAPKIDW